MACQIVSLDKFIAERNSFLKADIEGYEYNMLLRAKKEIAKYRPLLAIAIYHNAVELFSIQLLINSMFPEYRMAIRHHSNTHVDTVLYAWVDR